MLKATSFVLEGEHTVCVRSPSSLKSHGGSPKRMGRVKDRGGGRGVRRFDCVTINFTNFRKSL